MAYSTQADLQTAVGGLENLVQLADLENAYPGDGGAGISAAVADAIADADGIIDSYVGHRYAVPLSAPSRTIKTVSTNIAARILRANRYKGQPVQEDTDADKVDREWLVGVSKGLYSLGVEPTPAKASIVNDKAGVRDTALIIGRERMKGFI
jgi:phage gp36-like protein